MPNIKLISHGLGGHGSPKLGGLPLTLNVTFTTVLCTNVLHCDGKKVAVCEYMKYNTLLSV